MIKLFDILCIFYHALSDASLVTAYMIIWIFEGKLAAYQKIPSILFTVSNIRDNQRLQIYTEINHEINIPSFSWLTLSFLSFYFSGNCTSEVAAVFLFNPVSDSPS